MYKEPFRLMLDLSVGASAVRQGAPASHTVAIKGELEYQACDDRACYLPATIPVGWKVIIRN